VLGGPIPAGVIPDEDQGLFGVAVQLPPAPSLERTSAMLRKVEDILAKVEAVDSYQTIGGYGAVTSTYQPNFGSIFVRLKPWEERHEEALHVKGIMARVNRELVQIPEAVAFPFNIPTISGFGAAAGFNFLLQDRSGSLTVDQLGAQTRAFLAAARQRPEFASLFTAFDPTYPQVKVELDREKARTLGVPVSDVFQAMSAAMGGTYVNDFNRFGRLYRVYVQADADYRRKPGDIGDVYVRSKTTSTMIPLSTLVTITTVQGTELTTRFNLLRSVEINGAPARGVSSGQALAALEEVFQETMPKEMGFAYSSLSYQEKIAPPSAPTFILAIVFVFLLLAAMYESWRLPWAVLLGSPLVALGAFFGVWLSGYDNNVYVQIGLIMLVGLAAKNAILIVEFAKAKHEEGQSVEAAALESARLRFRPILMTAFAFILGVVPLMLGGTGVPGYRRRQVAVAADFRGLATDTPGGAASLGDIAWWKIFQDETLQSLIRTALAENYDLRIAAARILEARAQVTIVRSAQFPDVSASASAPYVSLPGDRAPLQSRETFSPLGTFDLVWELDLWGRLRRATEAARAQLLASEDVQRFVVTTLVSDVATAYFQLRELDLELEISRRTLTTRQEAVRLVTLRYQGGVAAPIELEPAEGLVC